MTRPPRAFVAAHAVVPTRMSPAEKAAIGVASASLGIDVSTFMRLSAHAIARMLPNAPTILRAAEARALTAVELGQLVGVLFGARELLQTPEERRRPMHDETIVDYARHERYVVMPHDPTEAALVGQAVARLVHAGRLRRVSTRPGVMASDLALQFGLPDAAIGVVPT